MPVTTSHSETHLVKQFKGLNGIRDLLVADNHLGNDAEAAVNKIV